MTTLLYCIYLFSAITATQLGSPDWRAREVATARLLNTWPLAIPVACICHTSTDPEVVCRAERIANQCFNQFVRQAQTNIANYYVWSQHERNGLPYIPDALSEQLANDTLACALLTDWASRTGDGSWYDFASREWTYEYAGYTSGLNALRFRVRQLLTPDEWILNNLSEDDVRKQWQAIKDKRIKQ